MARLAWLLVAPLVYTGACVVAQRVASGRPPKSVLMLVLLAYFATIVALLVARAAGGKSPRAVYANNAAIGAVIGLSWPIFFILISWATRGIFAFALIFALVGAMAGASLVLSRTHSTTRTDVMAQAICVCTALVFSTL